MLRRTVFFLAAALGLAQGAIAQEREFINVAGDVYLFRNQFHMSLIVPTSEGTVRVDPINAEAGAWLNDNLSQITDQPITHLIYSHSHGDHASGGNAHPDALTIAHKDAPATIAGTKIQQRIGDAHVFELGGKTFELTNLGPGHDNHMVVVTVRPENVAFIVDIAAPKRLPWRDFGGSNVDQWLGQIKAAQEIDFVHFAPGHGRVGKKEDLQGAVAYLTDLRAQVLAGLKAGKDVATLQTEVKMEGYSDFLRFNDWRALNVAGMAAYLEREGLVN